MKNNCRNKRGMQNRIFKYLMAIMLCLTLAQSPAAGLMAAQNVEAASTAVKNGLKKEKGKYYYYVDGVKAVNTWKSVKVKGVTYKYYFTKNGAAYAGKGTEIAVKKINGKSYGFDKNGRMVKGVYVAKSKFYFFNKKTGVLDSSVSSKLRKASKYEKAAGTLKTLLKKYAGNPVKTEKISGCYGNGIETFYYYKNFVIDYGQTSTGKEVVLDYFAK